MRGIGASSAKTVARDNAHWVLSDANAFVSLSGGAKPDGLRGREDALNPESRGEVLNPEVRGDGTSGDITGLWVGRAGGV
jgi:hypothetical protein